MEKTTSGQLFVPRMKGSECLRGVDLVTGLRLVGMPDSKTALYRPALITVRMGDVVVEPVSLVGESPYDIEPGAILATYECNDIRVMEAYVRAFAKR